MRRDVNYRVLCDSYEEAEALYLKLLIHVMKHNATVGYHNFCKCIYTLYPKVAVYFHLRNTFVARKGENDIHIEASVVREFLDQNET
jgi:hypothetical protein